MHLLGQALLQLPDAAFVGVRFCAAGEQCAHRSDKHLTRSKRAEDGNAHASVVPQGAHGGFDPIAEVPEPRGLHPCRLNVFRRLIFHMSIPVFNGLHCIGRTELAQSPNHHGDDQDDLTCTGHKAPAFAPHFSGHFAQPRPAVGGPFHGELAFILVGQPPVQCPSQGQSRNGAGDIEAEQEQPLHLEPPYRGIRDDKSNQKCVHRQPRGTGHQRRDQDGDELLAFAGDGPGRHDRRHGTRHAPNQRHHGAPAQAQSFQKPIAQKAHARHVTGRFQCTRQAEQNHDLRHKHNNASDAVQNPVEQQPFPPTLGHGTVCGLVQPPKRAVYSIHGRLGPRVHCLENTEEHQSQDGVSPDRVGQDAVNARRTLRGFFPREFGSIGDERFGVVADVLHAPAGLFQLQGSRRFLEFRTRCFKCLGLSVVQPNGQVTGPQVPGELRFCGTWKVGFQGVEGGAQ